jgi:hypothetical protein
MGLSSSRIRAIDSSLRVGVAPPHQLRRELQCAERLPPFVRRHPRVLFQPLLLVGDRLRIQPDELFDGRLRQDGDRLVDARDQGDGVGCRRRCVEPLHLLQHERHQHGAEQLVLAQDLMQ